ncbi:MAG: hypothetical protein NTY03_04285 [Candidatus Bathyarchaeota archaeon]|nr:hypothetical protein [Candidatus Bathyarchaeota archaeon]
MGSPIWVKTNYPEGEFIDISKAFALRVAKGSGNWYHVNAEFILGCDEIMTMERTLWSFTNLQEAKDYFQKLLTKTTGFMEDL